VGKTFNKFAYLGCELHKNAFGGGALSGSAGGGAIALPRPSSRYKGEERDGRERVMNREGRKRREWKGEGGYLSKGPEFPPYATVVSSHKRTRPALGMFELFDRTRLPVSGGRRFREEN